MGFPVLTSISIRSRGIPFTPKVTKEVAFKPSDFDACSINFDALRNTFSFLAASSFDILS